MPWSLESWREKRIRQAPLYADSDAVSAVMAELAARPGLVPLSEVLALRARLAAVEGGKGFLLQGGDCGESFGDGPEAAAGTARLLSRMAAILAGAAGPVVVVARLAGQYAKPRSEPTEAKAGATLPNYRGDIVNGIAFSPAARAPDPKRMLVGYAKANETLDRLKREGEIFTSHEALLLPFEQALARKGDGLWYSSSAHMLWLGYRTRFPGEAHAEFLRGVANPLGVKVGPESGHEDLKNLLRILNPANEPGKVTLICRFGAGKIGSALPLALRAIAEEGFNALWACDPMHGNTRRTAEGLKTRRVGDILSEALDFVSILRAEGVRPSGIHLELTGNGVAECGELARVPASRNHTHCDPRLNPAQALDLASVLAAELQPSRTPARARA